MRVLSRAYTSHSKIIQPHSSYLIRRQIKYIFIAHPLRVLTSVTEFYEERSFIYFEYVLELTSNYQLIAGSSSVW